METLNRLIIISIPVVSALFGLALSLRPDTALEAQRKFYTRLNWQIEPISMQVQVKRIKVMGLVLITTTLASVVTVIMFLTLGRFA